MAASTDFAVAPTIRSGPSRLRQTATGRSLAPTCTPAAPQALSLIHILTALFLAARVWDAINDPLMGAIVEKCHFKHGKYIPWFVGLCIPYGISTVLVFTTPESISKVAYAWFTYILFGMLFTGIIIPVTSLSSSMTQDPIERAKLNSFRMFCSGIGGVACSILVPKLSESLGTTPQNGYQRAMLILSVVMVISFLVAGKVCKERVPESAMDKEEPFRWRDIGTQFAKNKPLLILFVMYLAAYTYNILVSSVGTYFCLLYTSRCV